MDFNTFRINKEQFCINVTIYNMTITLHKVAASI